MYPASCDDPRVRRIAEWSEYSRAVVYNAPASSNNQHWRHRSPCFERYTNLAIYVLQVFANSPAPEPSCQAM